MKQIFILVLICLISQVSVQVSLAEEKEYIGSESCKDCHEDEYDKFIKYSKKSSSFESIKKMEKKLTPEEYQACFECHTTGYGKKGGFVSEQETPHLKEAGCEVCHGPGSLHAESEDPDDIVRLMAMEDCIICHNADRVEAFDFKPLLYGGAH